VFFVENGIYGLAYLQDTRCLEKVRYKPEQDTQMLNFIEGKGTGTSTAENRV
jgi:hypothetical protein